MHNKSETTLFSKSRGVYLDRDFPHYRTLHYYDKKKAKFAGETVPLADKDWPIRELETPEEFQRHYLSIMGGHAPEDVEILMGTHLEDE